MAYVVVVAASRLVVTDKVYAGFGVAGLATPVKVKVTESPALAWKLPQPTLHTLAVDPALMQMIESESEGVVWSVYVTEAGVPVPGAVTTFISGGSPGAIPLVATKLTA
jgi:hypothetical protein